MASILMGRICRCCLIKTPRMHKLREFIKEDVQIEDMLTQTVPNFNIELEDTAPLPVEICKECLEKLRISYEFHQQCMDTNQELRKMLGLEEDVDEEIFVTESADLNASDDFLNESDVLMEDFKKEPLDDISNGGNSSLKEPISDLADALSPSMQVDPVKIEGDLEDQKLEEGSVNDNSSDEYWPNDEKDDSDSNFFEKTKNSSEDSKPKRKYSRKVTSRSSGNTDCTQCDKKFTKSNLLKRHMSVHSMENEFVCDICQYRFSTDRRLRTHHTLKHKQTLEINIAGGPYPCPECPMIFESTKALASHKVMHMERDFKCKVCGINLKTNAAVTRHMNYKHPDVLPFKCQICDKGFPVENHLNDHMNEHLGIRKHKCEICEKTFSNTTNLAEHKRVHTGESPFLCCHCGKPFKTANVLRQHIQRHGEKNFHCPECPMKFFVKINLQKHMTSHTKIKHFVCDICGSGFTRQDSLKTHKFKHTGERPFKCEDCNMSFVFKRHLKRHKITHTGEKPHMCTYCDRAYAASGDLVKHLRTHVGEKTYFCDECPEAFKYSTDLKDHKNLHYKEKALRENKDGILNVQKIDDDVVEVDMQQSDEVILNLQENNEVVVSLQPSYNIVILPQKDEIINLPQNLIVVSEEDYDLLIEKKNLSSDIKPKRKYHRKKPLKPAGKKTCPECNKTFAKRNLLNRHMLVHSMDNKFVCDDCPYRFASERQLKVHKTSTHMGLEISIEGGPYPCPDCPKVFQQTRALAAHRVMHLERDFKCQVCGVNLKTLGAVTRHMTCNHPGILPHKCQMCDEAFPVESRLKDHMDKHLGQKKYKCDMCEKSFPNTTVLKDHKRSHTGESPFLCPHCGKSFKTANVLREHLQRHGDKKFQCPECPMKFHVKHSLSKHMISHSKEKRHICDVCGSAFSRQDSLKAHKFKHTGERPFKCPECNLSFVFKGHLQKHQFIHTGKKPHVCTYCDRAYASSGDLVKHLRTHVGENTYICDVCPETFKYLIDLKEHKNQHYKEKCAAEKKNDDLASNLPENVVIKEDIL